ncbi:hypothetical protein GCM10022235_69950 [Kribbella ginsengisoli]|uniref:Uncharacterized protein n=1 Tax=Kribbella ginsengisoli TaxID=363865 RepID=A0ABP6YUC4_9ACTN
MHDRPQQRRSDVPLVSEQLRDPPLDDDQAVHPQRGLTTTRGKRPVLNQPDIGHPADPLAMAVDHAPAE